MAGRCQSPRRGKLDFEKHPLNEFAFSRSLMAADVVLERVFVAVLAFDFCFSVLDPVELEAQLLHSVSQLFNSFGHGSSILQFYSSSILSSSIYL